MSKKKFPLWAKITSISVSTILAVGMGVGTSIAYRYEGLLNTFFSKSDYVATEAEKKCAQEVVKEGSVLLQNKDNALPLKTEKKLAIFGQNSVDFVYGGSGSGAVDVSTAPTLKTALEKEGFIVDQNLWDFYSTGKGKSYRKTYPDETGRGAFSVNEVPASVINGDSNALKTIKDDEVAIVTIGRSGGESSDLPLNTLSTGYRYLQVDDNERDTIKLACANFDKVILIVNTNNPIELGFLEDVAYQNVKSVLWCGGVGQEGLYGLASVIAGTSNPSGKLVDTFAYDSTSAPSFNNMGDFSIANADNNTQKANKYLVYGEGIYVGYRYYETRYEDVLLNQGNAGSFNYDSEVQYPFGYGLSYTTFEYSNFKVSETSDGNSFEITVDVTNTGDMDGKDVIEVYVHKPYNGKIETSAIELVGVAKTNIIKSGETVSNVEVKVDKKQLTSYDYKDAKTYVLDAGDYYFSIGNGSHEALNNIHALLNTPSVSGNASLAKLAFTQEAIDKVTFAKSDVTDYSITNQFEDADINKYDDNFKYLSRSNWVSTLVSSSNYQNKSWTAPSQLIEDLKWNRSDAVINDTSLEKVTFNSTSTSYTIKDLIGVDYNDSKWDDLVNQLTWNQAAKLVRIGGYSTMAIDSIGLPSTQDKDGPSGISGTLVGGTSCMAWPAEVVMSSTWNKDLIEEVGIHIGEDSIAANVAGWYAPGIDIHRSPYSGRNFEYFSEDGYLSGIIAASEMKGVRSMGVIAYMKHFALNDQETNRYGGAYFANEQEIREICLKGFEYATIEGNSVAVMVSMNRIGATWAGAHKGLMTNVLRNEWGFKGMAITDQASVTAMYYQDMISGLYGGTDIWLNSNAQLWPLSAVNETVGGLTNSSANYKENNTVNHYIHNAAKNIIYAVTNSNAVQEYSSSIKGNSRIFNWQALLWSVDAIIWLGAIAGIALPIIQLVKEKKEEK